MSSHEGWSKNVVVGPGARRFLEAGSAGLRDSLKGRVKV